MGKDLGRLRIPVSSGILGRINEELGIDFVNILESQLYLCRFG